MTMRVVIALVSLAIAVATQLAVADVPKGVMRFQAVVVEGENLATASIDTIEIDAKRRSVRYYGGKVITDLVICEDRGWYCLSDGNLEFSIPSDCCEQRATWSRDGIVFKVINREGGKDGDVVTMTAIPDGGPAASGKIYQYSKSRGLVSIMMYLDGPAGRYPAFYVRR